MYCAARAAETGLSAAVAEHGKSLGRKLGITGKGRCNITNNCDPETVLKNVPRNPRFLYSALSKCSPADVMEYFEGLGVPLKTERGQRVFPVSDKAGDVVNALENQLRRLNVEIIRGNCTRLVIEDGRCAGALISGREVRARAVVLATGGLSYPLTGSTGDGYRMAAALGHTIAEPVGSLVPLVERGHDCAAMQGLALKNVTLRLKNAKGKVVFEEFGELLFTHFGLSGPIVLSASAHMDRKGEAFTVDLDLKPALDEKALDDRLLRDFEKYANRDFSHALDDLLPRSMIPVVIKRSGIPGEEKVHSVTKQQRHALLNILKHFTIDIACKAPVEDAIVTSGGVKVREVDPATMESKLVRGLYFAGEVLDVDAYTGGFNLQIAWATGRAAGLAAAQTQEESE